MIDSVFDNYLKQENTDFALLLTAKWGVGKTYYVKDYLKKPKNKEIKTAYISLYGLSSTKEIDSQIFAKLYPGKNSIKKYGGILLKIVSKNLDVSDFLKFDINEKTKDKDEKSIEANFDGLEKFIDLLSEKPDTNETQKILICLDDLERKNDSFSLKEICGYINYLTENGFKVLVISNNERIDSQDFKALKEKTFGVEVEFNPDTETILKNIIESTFTEDRVYQNFLLEQLPLIMEVFFKNSQNLRIFKLVLHTFQFIREVINDRKNELKNISVNDYLTNVLRFICAVTVECREGEMLFEHGEDIRVRFTWADDLTDNPKIKKVAKEENNEFVPQVFFSNYFGRKDFGNYTFHKSIFDFIFKGLLDKEKLLNELIKIDKDSLSPAQIAINLCYRGHHEEISDEIFAENLRYAKDFVIQGQYKKIDEYLNVIAFLNIYANNYKIKYSEDEILVAIQTALKAIDEEEMKDFLRSHSIRNEFGSNIYEETVANLVSQELGDRSKNDFVMILKEQRINQLATFFEKELFNPVFYDTTNAKGFFDFIKDMTYENLLIVRECLETRYYRNRVSKPEIEYDAKIILIELLESHIKQREFQNKPIKKRIFERILKIFQFELPTPHIVE